MSRKLKIQGKPVGFLLILQFILAGLTVPAFAIDYTVTYNANSGYVGAVQQAGAVSGSVPISPAQVSGSTHTVLGAGNLARQGFTFSGWNTSANGSGTNYSPGNTFSLTSNVTLYAVWTVPVAARLIANGGSIISVTNPNSVAGGSNCLNAGIRGITSDGTNIYYRPSTAVGYICKATPAGVLLSAHAVSGLASVPSDSLAIVYGSGCLFVRKNSSTLDSIYCISTTDWSLTSIGIPAGYSLPSGGGWLYGNFIQFPDGRVGSVGTNVPAASWRGGGYVGTGAGQCPSGTYCKTLRIYNVSGSGSSVQLTHSTDFTLVDNVSGWPSDDHGIATDGTYLYQVRHARGYKVWALENSLPSYIVFNADADGNAATTPSCGASAGITGTFCSITYPVNGSAGGGALSNSTYFGRAHGLNKYLIGDYDATSSRFWLSNAATPPAGPGNPDLVPPVITSGETFTAAENIATSFDVASIVVGESATITVAVGLDGSLFNLIVADTATANLRFKTSPDFEAPLDIGSNNIYNVTISATDAAGNTASKTLAIVITNLNESSSTSPPSVSGDIYKGITITISINVNVAGKVGFFVSGKRIPGCLARPTSGSYPNFTATCSWKPAVTGYQNLTATLTPSDSTFASSTSTVATYWVLKRTNRR